MTAMHVLAIDPASAERDRGIVLMADQIAFYFGQALPDAFFGRPPTHVVVEAQWLDKSPGAAPADRILKLARYAGRLQQAALARWPGARGVAIPVHVWKAALFGSAFASVPKKIFSANLAQLPALAALAHNHNLLDAGGIALACCKLGATALQKYTEEI